MDVYIATWELCCRLVVFSSGAFLHLNLACIAQIDVYSHTTLKPPVLV